VVSRFKVGPLSIHEEGHGTGIQPVRLVRLACTPAAHSRPSRVDLMDRDALLKEVLRQATTVALGALDADPPLRP
jgi:hypothetical protein